MEPPFCYLYKQQAKDYMGNVVNEVYTPFPIQGDPKGWDPTEAGVSVSHRDLLPQIRDELIQMVPVSTKPGIILEGPPGVGKSAMLHILAGSFRQNQNWLVVYIPDCSEWLNSTNPRAYFLARVEEGLRGWMNANNLSPEAVPGMLKYVLNPPNKPWKHYGEHDDVDWGSAWIGLCEDTNIFFTLLVIDEVNELVKGSKINDKPFHIAKFDSRLKKGCRLVSGTPLHNYIHTLSAGYSGLYIRSALPFTPSEQKDWLRTVSGRRVAALLPPIFRG